MFQLFLLWNSWCDAETTKIHEQETTLSVQARSQMLDGSPETLSTQIKSTALKLYGAPQSQSVCKEMKRRVNWVNRSMFCFNFQAVFRGGMVVTAFSWERVNLGWNQPVCSGCRGSAVLRSTHCIQIYTCIYIYYIHIWYTVYTYTYLDLLRYISYIICILYVMYPLFMAWTTILCFHSCHALWSHFALSFWVAELGIGRHRLASWNFWFWLDPGRYQNEVITLGQVSARCSTIASWQGSSTANVLHNVSCMCPTCSSGLVNEEN